MLTQAQKNNVLRTFCKRNNTRPTPVAYLKADLVALVNLIETRFDIGLANLTSGGSPVPANQREELLRLMVDEWS